MGIRKLTASTAVAMLIGLGLVAANSASAATLTNLYHPNEVSRDFNVIGHNAGHGWTGTATYEGVLCILPGVTCPAVSHNTVGTGGAPPVEPSSGVSGYIASSAGGVASVAATGVSTWASPSFVYRGASDEDPNAVTFNLDRRASVQALLDLGGNATYRVQADNLTKGTSLTIIDTTPIPDSAPWTAIPTVNINPNQLVRGDSYRFRIVTRFSYPVGVIPTATVHYDNVVMSATEPDADNDGIGDDTDNCPTVSNPGQADDDNNGIGNACDTFNLSIDKRGDGNGTVTSTPIGIACGVDCEQDYTNGTEVELRAQANAGSTFLGFTGGDCVDEQVCIVTMNRSRNVKAVFASTEVLTVDKVGRGSGTVVSSPGGINCGPDCSEAYAKGTMVELTATPDEGSTFVGFEGGNCGGQQTCIVRMNRSRDIQARFREAYTLAIDKRGAGNGTVTSSPAGIDCGLDCTEEYVADTLVTLTATTDPGSEFLGFTGGTCVDEQVCTVTMNRSRKVQAEYRLVPAP